MCALELQKQALGIEMIVQFYSPDKVNALNQSYIIQAETLPANIGKDSPVHSSNDFF